MDGHNDSFICFLKSCTCTWSIWTFYSRQRLSTNFGKIDWLQTVENKSGMVTIISVIYTCMVWIVCDGICSYNSVLRLESPRPQRRFRKPFLSFMTINNKIQHPQDRHVCQKYQCTRGNVKRDLHLGILH